MEEPSQPPVQARRLPLGTHSSRCDDKGRIRLPKEILEWMQSFPEPEFFITTLEGTIGKIYPISVWRDNGKVFAEHKKNPKLAADLARYADFWGSLAEIDGQQRVLVSPNLRRKLGIENQPVHLRYYNDGIEIYSQAALDASMARAESAIETVLPDLMSEGLK